MKCPPSVPKDTPLEDDKAWLENSMKMATAWYKNYLESGYHGACASASAKTVKLPARVIDVGPKQSPYAVSRRPYFGLDWSTIPRSTVSDAKSVFNAYPELHTAFQGPGGSELLNRLVADLPNPEKVWGKHPRASSTSIQPLAAEMSRLSPKHSQAKALTKFPRIVETNGRPGKYLTLSYCWGWTQKGKLMTANLEAYKQCLPVDKLSRTIRDAVTVTRALGFRNLWVDALCIIQDSDPDKKSQLPLMGSIYQDSAITLAAAVGSHADAGLFAIRDPHAWRPCPVYKEAYPTVSPARSTPSSPATTYMIRPSTHAPGSSKRKFSHGEHLNLHPRASAGPVHPSAWPRRRRALACIRGRARIKTFANS